MAKDPAEVTEYLDSLPEAQQPDMRALHEQIKKAIPKEPIYLQKGGGGAWMICYRRYTEVYDSGREVTAATVALSRRSSYISLYVLGFDREQQKWYPELAADRLGKVKVGRGCINITRLANLDVDVALETVQKAVAMRNAEAKAKG